MLYHSLQGFHLVWTSQALGWGCCNPCPYRMHSSHWQLLSVKTGSVPSHPLQKALPSPQWHLRVLCCSSERSEITLAAPHPGALLWQIAAIDSIDFKLCCWQPVFIQLPPPCTTNSGTPTPSCPAAMQKGSSVWLSHV